MPEKIFIEMARDLTTTKKGKRTKSRREQLLNLYQKIAAEDAKSLSKELEQKSDSELQSNKLFLYYMQLGKCMYSGQPIDICASHSIKTLSIFLYFVGRINAAAKNDRSSVSKLPESSIPIITAGPHKLIISPTEWYGCGFNPKRLGTNI